MAPFQHVASENPCRQDHPTSCIVHTGTLLCWDSELFEHSLRYLALLN